MSHVSESRALQRMRDALREIERLVTVAVPGNRRFAILDLVNEADRFAMQLEGQVARGIHTNPPLVIFSNPPLMVGKQYAGREYGRFRIVGKIGTDVHEVRYTHVEDGKSYKHPFDSGDVEMFAIVTGNADRKAVLLTGGSGQPLWKDFE